MKTDWFNNKSKLIGAAVASSLLATNVSAQESSISVPWENIVNADDTAVFWVLAGFAVLLLILIWVVAGVTNGLLSDKELWKGKWARSAKAVAALVGGGMLLSSTSAMAQAETAAAPMFEMSDGLFWIMVIVNAFLLVVLLGMLYNLSSLIKSLRSKDAEETAAATAAEKSIWEGALSAAVPIEEEKDILMDHEYDGIMELDNKLPPWWLYMFYFTIAFGVIYFIYYQLSDGPGQYDEYNTEMAIAAEEKEAMLANSANNVDENTATVLTDATSIANGKAKFDMLCIACHAQSGGSTQEPLGVGPNLTDEYWINGGGIHNIFKTIKYGVPAKGMISWEAQLTPVQIQEVASYIISLQGSNPENAREPQGEIWEEGDEVAAGAQPTEETAQAVEVEEIERLTDAASLANGKKVFDNMCIACHGITGGSMPGGVGPNLTDEYWISGGGMNNVVKLINDGVPAKGMVPWKGTLSPQQIQEVASYILSLQGSNPEGAKEPEGDKWEEGDEVAAGNQPTEETTQAVEVEEIERLTDAASLANGKKVFDNMCIACHGITGGSMPGGVGPNLTDEYWISGGGMNNVVKLINDGVPAKGMIPWRGTLSPQQIQEVASYIISLQGSNPGGAKEPEGEKWEGK